MTEIKGCPFCGGNGVLTARGDTEGVYKAFVTCCCGGRSARAYQFGLGATEEEAKTKAVTAWNRRNSDALLREALAVVEPFERLADDYLTDTVNFDDEVIMAGRMTRRGCEAMPPRVTFRDFRAARSLASRLREHLKGQDE